jgi:hypothetical protein
MVTMILILSHVERRCSWIVRGSYQPPYQHPFRTNKATTTKTRELHRRSGDAPITTTTTTTNSMLKHHHDEEYMNDAILPIENKMNELHNNVQMSLLSPRQQQQHMERCHSNRNIMITEQRIWYNRIKHVVLTSGLFMMIMMIEMINSSSLIAFAADTT